MSSDRQRLVGAIRRIALTPEERRQLLGDSANRGDQAGAGAKAASQGEESRICCDGSTAPPNAGTTERDPDAGGQTGLNPDDPALLTAGDGTLSGVTDCSTGEPVCMDGDGFIPPDGWDAPNDPPIDPAYDSTVYYRGSVTLSGGGGTVLEYFQLCSEAQAFVQSYCPDVTPDANCSGGGQTPDCDGVDGQSTAKFSCLTNHHPVCDEPPPVADTWPSDGCVNLIVKGGKIVGSKYDPENGGAYSTPTNSIELCDGASRILYQPLPGGGFRAIESSAGSAVSGAVGYTYSADGTLTGTITQAEWDATAP